MTPTPDSTDAGQSLVVYSDYVCPFCYLGRATLQEYLADAHDPPSVEWRPFDLRGYKRGPAGTVDFDADDGKDEAYHRRVRENVERLGERHGVDLALEAGRGVDSRDAQQAALFVRREYGESTFRDFHDAVFDALWREGRDIEDPEVLAALGDSVGVDPSAVRSALVDECLSMALAEQFAVAERDGVVDIPTFAYAGGVERGVAPPERLHRLVEGDARDTESGEAD